MSHGILVYELNEFCLMTAFGNQCSFIVASKSYMYDNLSRAADDACTILKIRQLSVRYVDLSRENDKVRTTRNMKRIIS